jgi:signal peptidase I
VSQPLPGSFLGRLAQSELPRRVLGAMASVFVPGAGHIILGYSRIGWMVAAVLLAVGAATVLCAMAAITTGFLIFGAIYILCTVACVVSIFALPPGPQLKEGLFALWPVFVLFVVFRGAGYVVQNYALSAVKMPSLAMAPMIGTGDIVFVSKHADAVRVGDVVLFEAPDKQLLIRRVIAVGGQRVLFEMGDCWKLSVDGHEAVDVLDEKMIARDVDADGKPGPDRSLQRFVESNGDARYGVARGGEISKDSAIVDRTLGSDELYVLSDKRDDLEDSRRFGPISRASIRGKALFVFMSGPSLAGPGRIWTPLSAAR